MNRKQGMNGRRQPPQQSQTFREPEMHRWPHPIDRGQQPPEQSDGALAYLCQAVSYQNQLLADIKTRMEQLTLREEP